MIKAEINRNEDKATITATGGVEEIASDIAVLINGLHTQLSTNDAVAGHMLRQMLTGLVNDPTGPLWTPMGGQTGVVFKMP